MTTILLQRYTFVVITRQKNIFFSFIWQEMSNFEPRKLLNMIRKQIPNGVTLCNLLCGILSIYTLYNCEKGILLAPLFILLGTVFDFFDGLVARLLKVSSTIGKELDSLADIVSFGIAPSLIVVSILQSQSQNSGIITFLPLVMALMSAYRLAKFNLDERQIENFIGLPTPANALLWISLPIINYTANNNITLWGLNIELLYSNISSVLSNPMFLIIGSLVTSFLLVSEIPMFSLKFKNLKWENNKVRFVFLAISFILIFLINIFAVPFIVFLYIIISLTINIFNNHEI